MGGSLSVEREAKTSGVPFVALLRGRQPWAPLLDELSALIAADKLRMRRIDSTFGLSKVDDAFARSATGHAVGKNQIPCIDPHRGLSCTAPLQPQAPCAMRSRPL